MATKKEMAQEIFDELVQEAIADLGRSGLDNDETFLIVREHFGLPYACRFCDTSGHEQECRRFSSNAT